MLLRITHAVLLGVFVQLSSCDSSVTHENKTKRNLYNLGDATAYSIFPVQRLAAYPQLQYLANNPPAADLTFKSADILRPDSSQLQLQQYPTQPFAFGNSLKPSVSSNSLYINGPTFLPQQHAPAFSTYQTQQQLLNLQSTPKYEITKQPGVGYQNFVTQHYPTSYPKQAAALNAYRVNKPIALQASNVRTHSQLLNSPTPYPVRYTSVPVIYGQTNGEVPTLKFAEPAENSQYKPQSSYNTLPLPETIPPTQQYIQSQQRKPSTKQAHQPENQYPAENEEQGENFISIQSPITQITQNYQAISPQFDYDESASPEQGQETPNAPQSLYDTFTNAGDDDSSDAPEPTNPTPHENQSEQNDADSAEDDDESDESDESDEKPDEKVHVKEEDFEKGYEEASKGFPSYHQKIRYGGGYDDDSGENNYRNRNYNLRNFHNDDDAHDRHKAFFTHIDSLHKPFYFENIRSGPYYHNPHYAHEYDHEGHYSTLVPRRAPGSSEQSGEVSDSKEALQNTDSKKLRAGKSGKLTNSPHRNYQQSAGFPRDSRRAGSSIKSRSAPPSPPKYEFGFQPILDTDAHSEGKLSNLQPVSTENVYKRIRYVSETKN